MASCMATQMRRRLRQAEAKSTGHTPGLYLRAERHSKVQFGPIYLGNDGPEHALNLLEKVLERLYHRHGIAQVQWYIERSLGLDVNGNIAWGNLDLTDQVVP